jgi:hypothetical protein
LNNFQRPHKALVTPAVTTTKRLSGVVLAFDLLLFACYSVRLIDEGISRQSVEDQVDADCGKDSGWEDCHFATRVSDERYGDP